MGNYYRVLRGVHSEGGNDEQGRPYQYGPDALHGDVVDSKSDLGRYNPPYGPKRFQKISDEEAKELLGEQGDGLEELTVTQLREIATCDTSDLTKKADIIARIRGKTPVGA